MDKVFIEQLHVDAIIGVYDFEKQAKQPLLFDVEMTTDIRPAALRDELALAIDYAAVAQSIDDFCQAHRFELLETLLERLANTLLQTYPISELTLKVHKPKAVPSARSVGVMIVRSKADFNNQPHYLTDHAEAK